MVTGPWRPVDSPWPRVVSHLYSKWCASNYHQMTFQILDNFMTSYGFPMFFHLFHEFPMSFPGTFFSSHQVFSWPRLPLPSLRRSWKAPWRATAGTAARQRWKQRGLEEAESCDGSWFVNWISIKLCLIINITIYISIYIYILYVWSYLYIYISISVLMVFECFWW